MIEIQENFDQMSWHDCHIWGMEFRVSEPGKDDWTSELILDIDFIVEWICSTDGVTGFRIAPANLVFHGVTDLKINIDCDKGLQTTLHPLSINHIERERIRDQKIYLDRPYYKWGICLNWPDESRLTFGSAGFSQILRAEPVFTCEQYLPRRES
jgi:hypothetical protein